MISAGKGGPPGGARSILFLTQVAPLPLDAGPKVRAYYVLRHLVEAGHAVTLATFTRPSDPPEALAELRRSCAGLITVPMPRARWRDGLAYARGLWDGRPFLITRDAVPGMYRELAAHVRERAPDVIHADQLWMAPYALAAAAATPGRRPATVLDQHNAVFQIPGRLAASSRNPARRALLAREARRLARYELATCRQFDHVVWVTDEDRAAFAGLAGGGGGTDSVGAEAHGLDTGPRIAAPQDAPWPPFSTIPICVDPAGVAVMDRQAHPRRVTFLGGMHWPPNAQGIRWFAAEIWPTVRDAVLDAKLTVIGQHPPPEFRRRPPGERIEAPGYVEDLGPLLSETAVFVVPLQAGGGMRVKIADAWCWGLPVVTTTIGAEGLAVSDGHNALLADTAADFATAVIRLLRDPHLARRIGAAGRETVETRYDWRQVYGAWDAVYGGLAG